MRNPDRVSPHRRRKKATSRSRHHPQPARRCKGYLLLPVVLVIAVVAAVAFLMNRESAIDTHTAQTAAKVDAARYVAEAGLRHALWQANASSCSGYGLPSTAFGAHSYQAAFAPSGGSPVSVIATATLAGGAQGTLARSNVTVYQPPQTVVLQPGPSGGKDNHLDKFFPTQNHGANGELRLRNNSGINDWRPLLEFDLSAIPLGTRISRATLELLLTLNFDGTGFSVDVHRMTQPWSENGSTWIERDTGQPWTVPGGDFDPSVATKAAVGLATGVHYAFDFTPLVQGWIDGAYPNYGAILRPTNVGLSNARFASSDHADPSFHPRLTVEYACECGKICLPPPSCDADFSPDTLVSEFSTSGLPTDDYLRGITYFPPGQTINGTPAPAGGGWVATGTSGRLVLLDMAGNIVDDGFDTGLSNLEGVTFVYAGLKAGHLAMVSGSTLYFSDPTVLPPSTSYSTHALPFVSNGKGISYIDGGTYDTHLAVADANNARIHIFDQSLNLVQTLASESILNGPEGLAHLRATDKFLVADKNGKHGVVIDTALNVTQFYDLPPFGWGTPSAAAIHPVSCDHVISDLNDDRYRSLNDSTPGQVDKRVASSSDDAEELISSSNVDLTSTDLNLVEDGGLTQMVGMRFDDISVPNGATIASAWIQFKTHATSAGGSNIVIRGEDVDDAAAFSATSANISSRAVTTASVSWSPGPWNTLGEEGPGQQTLDIAPLIQEIVDRPGWVTGNALVLILSGSGERIAASFDGDAAGAPLLHIEF